MTMLAGPVVATASRWRWLRTKRASFAAWVLAAALTGACFTLADALTRLHVLGLQPAGWTWRGHLTTTVLLFSSWAIVIGAGGWLATRSDQLTRLFVSALAGEDRWPAMMAAALPPIGAAAFAAAWVCGPAATSDLIGWAAIAFAAIAASLFVVFCPMVLRGAARLPRSVRVGIGGAGLLAGSAAAWIDMTVFVALYPMLHAIGELVAGALWFVSILSLVRPLLARRPNSAAWVGAISLVAAVVFLALGGTSWAESRLRHTANQQAYAGRLLTRHHQLAFTSVNVSRRMPNEPETSGTTSRRDARPAFACPEAWWPSDAPMAPAPVRAALPPHPNVVVFYVDTLRYDTATDPRVMPNLARFARGATLFTRAYATGSDTRSSLPAMIRGNYDFTLRDQHTVLAVAKSEGLQTAVAIGKSPREFLAKHVPHFKFGEVLETNDADSNRKVWGYGAHRETSAHLVDASIDWLEKPNRKRFLLWQFHFDLHAWKQMDEEVVERRSRMLGIPRYRSEEHWRYRTVAASIDAEFGRFLRELERIGIADDTIVVFLSDHGEGMGHQGFWLHSLYLTENLVHVPLVVRVPGLEPARIDRAVSLIDVAPTLVRIVSPGASMMPYHGEDLIAQLSADSPSRRFPLLMRGMDKERVVRLGVIDEVSDRKLVLPIDTGLPELYDLGSRSPDDVCIAEKEPKTVDRLVNVVMEGAMNPRVRRRHDRCRRESVNADDTEDTLATQSRQLSGRPGGQDAT